MKTTRWIIAVLLALALTPGANESLAQSGAAPPAQQAAPPARPTPPTRDPNTPGYVTAKELPDGSVPPSDTDGNFIIGPTHNPAPEMTVQEGVPQSTVCNFTMSSADSKIYPGIAREPGTFGTVDPSDPAKLIVTTSHPAPYTRRVAVSVPKQYVPGTAAPFIVGATVPTRRCSRHWTISSRRNACRSWWPSQLATGAATLRAASVAWNTTRCRDVMRSSSQRKCCHSSKNNAASNSPGIRTAGRRWATAPAARRR